MNKWIKTGGHDQSEFIAYRLDGTDIEIYRNRIAGEWTKPTVYQGGRFVLGFRTVREAKEYAENLGKPLIEVL